MSRFLEAFNLHYGRTHTVKLDVYQQLETLLVADTREPRHGGPLCIGGHTIYCEPDPSHGPPHSPITPS